MSYARRRRLGDASSDFNSDPIVTAGSDPYLNAIRAISVPMGQLQQRIDAETADALNDASDASSDGSALAQWQSDLAQMNLYAAALPAAIAAFKASPSYTADAATANELHNWLAFVIDWAGSTLSVIGQLPTDAANYVAGQLQGIANAAGNAANTAGWNLAKAAIPLGVVAIGLVYLLKQAETTRTYRQRVA